MDSRKASHYFNITILVDLLILVNKHQELSANGPQGTQSGKPIVETMFLSRRRRKGVLTTFTGACVEKCGRAAPGIEAQEGRRTVRVRRSNLEFPQEERIHAQRIRFCIVPRAGWVADSMKERRLDRRPKGREDLHLRPDPGSVEMRHAPFERGTCRIRKRGERITHWKDRPRGVE